MNEKQIARSLYIAQALLRSAGQQLKDNQSITEAQADFLDTFLEVVALDQFLVGSEADVAQYEATLEAVELQNI